MSRLLALLLVLAAMLVVVPASAQEHATPAASSSLPGQSVIASRLTNSPGFTWSEDGTFSVTLAETGGSTLPTKNVPIIEAFDGVFDLPSTTVLAMPQGQPVRIKAYLVAASRGPWTPLCLTGHCCAVQKPAVCTVA